MEYVTARSGVDHARAQGESPGQRYKPFNCSPPFSSGIASAHHQIAGKSYRETATVLGAGGLRAMTGQAGPGTEPGKHAFFPLWSKQSKQ